MESLDTMLSDAVSISALLSYTDTTKYHKFRQLKKQMSNISTPSPAASPEPSIESDVISQTVLKTINHSAPGDENHPDKTDCDQLDTPVTLGEEFFSSSLSVSSSLGASSRTCLVQRQTPTELTSLSPPGKIPLCFYPLFLPMCSVVFSLLFVPGRRFRLFSLYYFKDLGDKKPRREDRVQKLCHRSTVILTSQVFISPSV